MIILKIIEWILHIALKMMIGVTQIVLIFIATYICFRGGVSYTTCDIIGFVFMVVSPSYFPSGIVTVKEFWPMLFFGMALDAVPAFMANVGVEGIYAVKDPPNKI